MRGQGLESTVMIEGLGVTCGEGRDTLELVDNDGQVAQDVVERPVRLRWGVDRLGVGAEGFGR